MNVIRDNLSNKTTQFSNQVKSMMLSDLILV